MKNKGIARFEKVSFEEFYKGFESKRCGEDIASFGYDTIKLPKRATKGSAGYDFFSPFTIELGQGETVVVPTGIRCKMDEVWVLKIYPRSGLGFKYRCQLDNTVGIIDSDYYGSSNEGHIMIKITNDSKSDKVMTIEKGSAFAQGIFIQYGLVEDDFVEEVRDGGFGSTSV